MFKFNTYHNYVGTSLSKCVISILDGDRDVLGMNNQEEEE